MLLPLSHMVIMLGHRSSFRRPSFRQCSEPKSSVFSRYWTRLPDSRLFRDKLRRGDGAGRQVTPKVNSIECGPEPAGFGAGAIRIEKALPEAYYYGSTGPRGAGITFVTPV